MYHATYKTVFCYNSLNNGFRLLVSVTEENASTWSDGCTTRLSSKYTKIQNNFGK